jgi:hypothetical protein
MFAMTTSYGQRGGDGPTAGQTFAIYEVEVPDVGTLRKRTLCCTADTVIATGFMHNGKAHVVVWEDQPAWEGEFGRLTARRVK